MAIASAPDFTEAITNVTTFNMANTPTAGTHLVLCRNTVTAFTNLSAITQTNVSWSRVGSVISSNRKIEVWIGVISASPGVGLDFGGVSMGNAQIAQWQGLSGSADVTTTGSSGGDGTAGDPCATASISPTASANVLLIGSLSRT
jgi:hypothetical protein